MRRSLSLGLALALTFSLSPLRAAEVREPEGKDAEIQRISVHAGKYTFYVDVRNRWGQWINNARGQASVIGDRQATLTVESDGYREARTYVSLHPNQTTYNVYVTLEDPSVWFDVKDENYRTVPNSTREDHFGAWGDEFKFVSRISSEGFSRFTSWDVKVRVNHMIPFGERVRVRDLGSYREVEVTVKRRDLTRWNNNIDLQIPSDAAFPEPPPAEEPPPSDARARWRHQAFQELNGAVE